MIKNDKKIKKSITKSVETKNHKTLIYKAILTFYNAKKLH